MEVESFRLVGLVQIRKYTKITRAQKPPVTITIGGLFSTLRLRSVFFVFANDDVGSHTFFFRFECQAIERARNSWFTSERQERENPIMNIFVKRAALAA